MRSPCFMVAPSAALPPSRLGRNDPQPDHCKHGLGAALDPELGQNMTHMGFDGLLDE